MAYHDYNEMLSKCFSSLIIIHYFSLSYPSKNLLGLKTSSSCFHNVFKTCFQDIFKTCLQDVFSVTSLRLPKCLEEILQDVLKTSRKTKNCYAEDVLKTPWRHVLKTSWNHVLMTSWRHSWRCLENMSWRHYEDKQNTYWRNVYPTNLNVYVTNFYFINLYLTILRRIQNALNKTHHSNIPPIFWNSSSISISRIKISDDCLEL